MLLGHWFCWIFLYKYVKKKRCFQPIKCLLVVFVTLFGMNCWQYARVLWTICQNNKLLQLKKKLHGTLFKENVDLPFITLRLVQL